MAKLETLTSTNAIASNGSSQRPQRHEEWIPTALQSIPFTIFLILDVGLIGVVIALHIISSRQNGIVEISNGETLSIFGKDVGINILWTTFPSLIFGLFASFWASMAEDSAVRQPYVELGRHGGARATKSIFLDYRTTFSFAQWAKAFSHGHPMIGIVLLSSLVFDKGISSLASSLLYLQQVPMDTIIPVSYNTTFNESGIGATLDWRPIFDTVSATSIWGASAIPWTNSEYAFRPYYQSSRTDSIYNLTSNTTAFSAYLDCNVIDSSAYSLNLSNGKVGMSASDRGCDVSQSFVVAPDQQIYFKTTSQESCSASTWYSRLVFTYGIYDNTTSNSLANVSVISCIPGYRETDGILTVAAGSGTSPSGTVLTFQPTKTPRDARPVFWRIIEQGLFLSTSFNPKTEWSTTDFGNIILYLAKSKLQPGTPTFGDEVVLSGNLLSSSIQAVFTWSYLTAVSTHGLSPSLEESATGMITVRAIRLFVLTSVAYVIIVVLAMLLVLAVALRWYAVTHSTQLVEKPEGLMSYALLLSNSGLMREREFYQHAKSKEVIADIAKDSIWEMGSELNGGQRRKIQRRVQAQLAHH